MKSSHTILTERFLALLLFVSIAGGDNFKVLGQENDSSEVFSSPVLDLGIVVKDLDKSASFYKDVIGCKEVKGFSAPPAFATSIGLVNEMEVVARVFVFGAGEKQSRLKMMSFPKAEASQTDQTYIHSTLGFSYLTLYVTDLSASIERLKKAKVTFLGKTPVPLGGKNALLVIRDPDGNFIELIGPMQD
jgi:catechol 2,3-dioxygenase-like lactoylglutathione lyase family enzyme